MKQFEITLIRRAPEDRQFQPLSIQTVQGDDLVELLSQFIMIIAVVGRDMMDEERLKQMDDSVPF